MSVTQAPQKLFEMRMPRKELPEMTLRAPASEPPIVTSVTKKQSPMPV